jgi:hypothetical protein
VVVRLPKPIPGEIKNLFKDQTFSIVEDRLDLIVENAPLVVRSICTLI